MLTDPLGRCARRLAIALTLLAITVPARALTPFTANEAAGSASHNGSGGISDANVFCPTGPSCGGYSASASAGATSGGFTQATVTLSGVPFLGGGAQSSFQTTATANAFYGIELTGVPNISVPVTVIASLAASPATGYLSDQASLTIADQVGDQYTQTCYDGTCFALTPLPVVLVSGREYLVSLQASATALADGTAFASADPTFVIDPAFAGAFTLVGVPGVVASVPEPQIWALMIVALGLFGTALRRNRGVSLARTSF